MTIKDQDKDSYNPNKFKGKAIPRYNMESSLEVAQAAYEKGGGACKTSQLAAHLKYKSAKNGAFLARLNSAKAFGFIESDRGTHQATSRAISIFAQITDEDRKQALVEAFLAVPVFNEMFQKLKDKPLPQETGLKNLLKTHYDVPDIRMVPALRIFRESARFAGFFELYADRLMEPIINPGTKKQPQTSPITTQKPPENQKGHHLNLVENILDPLGSDNIHFAIMGLLRELPSPGPWEKSQKEGFMNAFRSTIDFIYPEKKEGES